ncbi:hypothetical protein H5410_005238 [Solanum commersonii]|uniref:Uncharacterized protein n=1 Tax=Solanum commersonii TaxID=4109 RepID=A0A9J6A711_SOLCO|nr:hypothetical protein H5410_005238 [Solanum commersonii]
MNIHNKTQITHAKINCVLKDSSCDTPLPKILMLSILATCASSNSTKIQLTQDQKGLSKAYNGLSAKDRPKGCSREFHTLTGRPQRGICQTGSHSSKVA